MKLAGPPQGISSVSHFDQLEQRSLSVVVDDHPQIALASGVIFHAIIVLRRGHAKQLGELRNRVGKIPDVPRKLRVNQPPPDREADQPGGIVNVQLPHDASSMAIPGERRLPVKEFERPRSAAPGPGR